MSDDCIKVAVRIRPLVPSEEIRGCQQIVEKVSNRPQVIVNGGKNGDVFTFNHVFSHFETQEMVYHNSVKPIVLNLFKGYNATILAYGQTGSGKTHTMGTAFNGLASDDIGVIPRAVNDIFDTIANMTDYSFDVYCSFMELYQERLYDLLSENSREQSVVDIREDSNRDIIIPNLTEIAVNTAEKTTECLTKGSEGRAVGATAMNATSSRSHAIFTITIQMNKIGDESNSSTKSKFHLVDLAGSERSKKTQATGARFKEGVKINQGLLALGNVISALGTKSNGGASSGVHISYRDSKLTRLLQDSLGGNSITLMIACVSPADYNIEETLSSLRYADRAKQIKNKPIVNQDPKTAEINRLLAIIQKLRVELLNATAGVCDNINDKTTLKSTKNVVSINVEEVNHLKEQLQKSQAENQSLTKRLESTLHDAICMEHRLNEAETANEIMVKQVAALKTKITSLNSISSPSSNTCPAEYIIEIRDIANDICAIDDLVRKNTDLMSNNDVAAQNENSIAQPNSSRNSLENDSSLVDSLHVEEDLKKKCELFTTKQVSYLDELNDIKQQLALKEELQRKLHGNFSNFCSFEENIKADGKIKDYETIIANLEQEREALLRDVKKNKSTIISSKLAEDRRKRVQQLEQEIADVKRKNKHQAQLLKQREKDQQKIVALQSDIHDMKAKKVKLVRTMKAESEDFRQWKLIREKEIVQLRDRDRKRDAEMVKKVRLHEKQQNVLKRKVEEAVAVNKRLKDAMDKHKNAQASRLMKKPLTQNSKILSENIATWMEQELEILISVIDAKQMIEQLIDERSKINMKLLKLKKLTTPTDADRKLEIEAIQENLQVRNAQIVDLQDKIKSTDIEAKTKSIFDHLQSMPEAKSALRYLFSSITDMRIDYLGKLNQIHELKDARDMAENLLKETDSNYRQQLDDLIRKKNKAEADYEEKIAVLLRELQKTGGLIGENGIKTESEQIREDEMEHLREKIERYEEEIYQLKSTAHSKRQITSVLTKDQIDSFFSAGSDDEDKDPDWHMTPDVRAAKKLANRSKKSTQSRETSLEESTENERHKCHCKTNCKNKSCGCKKLGLSCSDSCKCPDSCINTQDSSITIDSERSVLKREATFLSADYSENKENDIENNTNMTPTKKIRLTSGDEDLTITPYPFGDKKKRKPLLDD